MIRRRIGLHGASDEALQLLPLLLANPEVELAGIYDPDSAGLADRLRAAGPELEEALRDRFFASAADLAEAPGLYAVIDSADEPGFADAFPDAVDRGVQVVTPLVARLLWGFGAPQQDDRKGELLQALHEVVESYNLTVDADALFRRMLEIAITVTNAEGGSVMLLDPEATELRVRVAVGVEPELWPKIRVPVGEGIAGRVVEEARALRLRGKADRQNFRIVRERLDVESALCVPLVHEERILGVLNLHHTSRADAFSEQDLEFAEQLAALDAQIIVRAQEHEEMRSRANRYTAVREVREILSRRAPLVQRLGELCTAVVAHAGSGIANLYLHDPEEGDLYLAASSLEGGSFGEEIRIALGQGVDGGVAQTREPLFLRRPDGSLAYAALPLVGGQTLAGVLAVQSGSDGGTGPVEEEALKEIAGAAAEEIVSLRREERARARATRIAAVNEAGIRLMSIADPAEVLRQGASQAAMVLEADHAILRLQDEESGRFAIRSYFGAAEGRLQERLFRLDKHASVAAIKRRAPLLIRELRDAPDMAEFADDVRSLLVAPLRREDVVVGTLALYDKLSPDRLSASSFADDDAELFGKLVSHLERALTNAQFVWRARQFRSVDEDTGLPGGRYLEQRLEEELARAAGRHGSLALAVCRVENAEEIERTSGRGAARQVLRATAEALRGHLRSFDVAARNGGTDFTVLLPDPGPVPGDRVSILARGVAEDVSKDDALNEPVRVALAFGYAVYPEDGTDAASLLERAREPRIRTV